MKDLEVLDDYDGIEYIVAISRLKNKSAPWIERLNAEEVIGKQNEKNTNVLVQWLNCRL